MIKTLSKKFVVTAMMAVSILLILLIGTINVVNLVNMNNRAWDTLATISRMSESSRQAPEGVPEKPSSPDNADKNDPKSNDSNSDNTDVINNNDSVSKPDSTDKEPPQRERSEYDIYMGSNFFYVDYDETGKISVIDVSRTSKFTEDEATDMADSALDSDESKGKTENCIYMVRDNESDGGCSVVFLDTSDNKRMALSILGISLLVGLGCWVLMLVIILLLSKKAIKPIAENIERQKQFITNAGHELKTPMAIIQSNADAMELYNGESKWSSNIKVQVERLTKLTNDMLSLARMDEENNHIKKEYVNVSEELEALVSGFEQSCENKHMKLNADIGRNIKLRCCKTEIEKLISILIDNAIKYGKSEETININLNKNSKGIILSVENKCDELPHVEPDKLFERFYRTDTARTQESGGCGIGLSMAKSIVESHNGTIKAEYIGTDIIKFTAIL